MLKVVGEQDPSEEPSMIAKDLIEVLGSYPADTEVYVSSDPEGYLFYPVLEVREGREQGNTYLVIYPTLEEVTMKTWECRKCGTIVLEEREPAPKKSPDGHVCVFEEIRE
jgi:hypothetical protein